MSRVAKAPVMLPNNVELTVGRGQVTVKGPKGTLVQHCNRMVNIVRSEDNDKEIIFKPVKDEKSCWAQAGTARAIVNNMVVGVTDGFEVKLELVGVGYRAQLKGTDIVLSLGYSHPIEYKLPDTVTAEVPSATSIVLKSINKQLVGQVAAEIRQFRPPEPYKGKGVRYAGEVIVRKEAKKK